MAHKVLIVEDEAIAALSLQESLLQLGYEITGLAASGPEALRSIEHMRPDLVLLDINLQGEADGIAVGRQLMQEHQLPVVFLTAYSDRATIERAREVFPYGYMIKPWQQAELVAVLETALYKHLADKRQQELQQTRNMFYAIIGHDLRSPLAALSVSSRALVKHLDALSREDIREFVEDMHQTVENLYAFTDNLLEWSRVQKGLLESRPEQLHLLPLAREAEQLLHNKAQQKQVQLHLEIEPALQLTADVNMLRSVLLNLLSNAIKFSYPGGEVWLQATSAPQSVAIAVKDAGRGMPQEQLASLFDYKTVMHTPGTQEEKGTGLGLLLCKEFVQAGGGSLSIESREGAGTTVRISLPQGNLAQRRLT
jgi:two-component system, sensor histidine kinase and response regulator